MSPSLRPLLSQPLPLLSLFLVYSISILLSLFLFSFSFSLPLLISFFPHFVFFFLSSFSFSLPLLTVSYFLQSLDTSSSDFHPQRSFSRPNPRSPLHRPSFSSDIPSQQRRMSSFSSDIPSRASTGSFSQDCRITEEEDIDNISKNSLYCVAHFSALKITLVDNVLGFHLPLLQVI